MWLSSNGNILMCMEKIGEYLFTHLNWEAILIKTERWGIYKLGKKLLDLWWPMKVDHEAKLD